MIKKIKSTYYIFITEDFLKNTKSLPFGINLHLVMVPLNLKEPFLRSEIYKFIDPILTSSRGEIIYN